jgi:1-acyl-sn-glycerol-3-phosphate acyltransferase
MGDAEIIPIGTRGRPGRGSAAGGSKASRDLAGPAKKGARTARAEQAPTETVEEAALVEEVAAPVAEEVAHDAHDALETPVRDVARDRVRDAVTAQDRGPLAGIPAGDWLAAFQHAAKELFGDQWEPQLARFLAFLRRRVSGDYVVDEYGFDREITERFFMTALRPIAQKWFRVEVRGAENIPAEGGALVVSNHSGTIPVDGLMTMVSIHDHTGRFLRPLGADLVFKMPIVSQIARKGGTTLACNEDAERMLSGGELVGVWPEGFKGIGKPYAERYKLQRFGRGGFVAAAVRTGVPIVPLSVVGAEEIYPLVGNIPGLARVLGIPYIPITPFFPWLGPLGLVPLPSKWLLEFGEPIRTDEFDAGAADDPMLVFDVTDQVRETIQSTLYSLLMQRESVFR